MHTALNHADFHTIDVAYPKPQISLIRWALLCMEGGGCSNRETIERL